MFRPSSWQVTVKANALYGDDKLKPAATTATMSHRYPAIPLDDSSGLGHQFESEVKKHHGDNPTFQYKDKNGAPIGPFAMLSYVSSQPISVL